jgi:hypothetical protein
MRNSTYQQHNTLFERIANRHPDIRFFHELEEGEILSGKFRTAIKFPAMILEYPDLGFNDNRTNVNQDFLPFGLAILMHVSKSKMGDEAFLKDLLTVTQRIALDSISYLRNVRRTDGTFFLETNNIRLNKVGPVFDNCYGWRVELRYQMWVDLNYYEDEWNDYDPDKFK